MPGRNDSRPIVIKRRKIVVAGAKAGGRWLASLVDVFTAMMAFFLMMWLLGNTTEDQRRGLADHFSPTIPILRVSGGGDGADRGFEILSQGQVQVDTAPPSDADPALETTMQAVETILHEALAAQGEHPDAIRHMAMQITEAGLQIEIFDLENSPLFEPGTDTPTAMMRLLARVLANALTIAPNAITLDGHVRAHAIVEREDRAWPLSVARPQVLHRLLKEAGVEPLRFRRLTGHGDRVPVMGNPVAPRNNRIELVLLRPTANARGR